MPTAKRKSDLCRHCGEPIGNRQNRMYCSRACTMAHRASGADDDVRSYVPTAAEIERQCELIQKGWTPQERKERTTAGPTAWEVPVLRDLAGVT